MAQMADNYVEIIEKKSKGTEVFASSLAEALQLDPLATVSHLVSICTKAMSERNSAWDRYRRKYRKGLNMGGSTEDSYGTNYIYGLVETAKCNITRKLPALVMQPVEPSDDAAADIFTLILRQAMKKAKLKDTTRKVVQHGCLTGTGWYKVWYNGKGKNGEVALEAIAPEDMLILPNCVDYTLSDMFIHRRRFVSEASLKAQYKVSNIAGKPSSDSRYDSEKDTDKRVEGINTYTVYECWVKDYDNDKWLITVVAGSTVLKKPYESPYDHNRAPFVPFYSTYDDSAPNAYTVGIGEVEQIEGLQLLADSLDNRIYKNIRQITARQRVLNPSSGIRREDVDDTPNRIYECAGRPQDSMMWDAPPSLSTDVYLYRERVEQRMQTVSGMFEVTQGQKPAGIQAARAISALQDAAMQRLEEKRDMLRYVHEDLGRLASSIIKQFYDEERIIRISSSKLFKVIGEYPAEITSVIDPITGEELEIDEGMQAELELKKDMWKKQNNVDLVLSDVDFDFDIVASTDTGLPEDKSERVSIAVDMFRLGAIDREALLEAVDYPDSATILKRMGGATTGKTPPELDPANQAMQQQQNQANSFAAMFGGGASPEQGGGM